MTNDFRPVVFAVESDQHAGATLSAMGPTPIEVDDGTLFSPGPINSQLYAWREEFYHDFVAPLVAEHDADLWWASNGDYFEGDHHNTHQIVSRHPGTEQQIARDIIQPVIDVGPKNMFVVRGTGSHVGKGGAAEEGFARSLAQEGLPIRQHPDTDRYSAYEWRIQVGPWDFDLTHHGKMGRTPRTRGSLVMLYAGDVVLERTLEDWLREDGTRPPTVAVRSHYHQFADSGDTMLPTRVVQTPCWTYSSQHAWKVASNTLPDIGGVAFLCLPGRALPELRVFRRKPKRSTLWTV